jgi:hypothetical protein
VFNRRNDPNNPYNLVDTGRAVRGEPAPAREAAAVIPPSPPPSDSPPSGTSVPSPTVSAHASGVTPAAESGLDLGLAREEMRDLALIVEYAQRQAPATLARSGSAGAPDLVVRIAQSRSFEARLHEAARRTGRLVRGPVVLFTASGAEGTEFYANLTFVQGHMAFHPDASRSEEFGLIDGNLGRLAAGAVVLGYVVLPEWVDLAQPMDIYWNDYQLTATLRP